MQNWLNCHSWRHKFWSTLWFFSVFSVQCYITQQNPVAFSTLYACHTSTFESARPDLMIDIPYDTKGFTYVNCYYDYTVNDVLWKDHEDGFHSQGLTAPYRISENFFSKSLWQHLFSWNTMQHNKKWMYRPTIVILQFT